MRVAWLLCLVGCYQPNREAACSLTCTSVCPAGLTCRNGLCEEPNGPPCDGDAGIDPDGNSMIDGTPGRLCPPPIMGIESPLVVGSWLGARLATPRYAIKFDLEGGTPVGIIRGTMDDITSSGSPIFEIILSDDAMFRYRSPRLAWNGTEIYVRMEPTNTDIPKIGLARRSATTDQWGLPAEIAIQNHGVALDDDPSPPTTTPERQMVISRPMEYAILREVSGGSWTTVYSAASVTYQTPTSEPVAFLGQAHLTEDGLRMVFRGRIANMKYGAFFVERPDLNTVFTGPARELPTLGDVSRPLLTSDCGILFYDRDFETKIYRDVYP